MGGLVAGGGTVTTKRRREMQKTRRRGAPRGSVCTLGGAGDGGDVKLCFCRRARSAVSSPFFCPSFSAIVGVFHSWLEARGADLPCAVVGYSKRQRVIKSEKMMKGKEEEAGVAGQWLSRLHVKESLRK